MDGELLSWNAVYRLVVRIGTNWGSPSVRRGHPDEYPLAEVVLCWLFSALVNLPLATAMRRLGEPGYRRGMRAMGYLLPPSLPHETTLRRRSRRADFWVFLTVLNMALIGLLRPDMDTLLIDSTPLPVPYTSRDPDAAWGHHGVHGYRWHTLTSADRVILTWAAHGANVHELTVAPILVRQAAGWGWRCRYTSGDVGYDSEDLHGEVRRWLGGMLVAPFNDRGGNRTFATTPLRAELNGRLRTREIRRVVRQRPEIDRMYSVLKSHRFGLYALPPWVRGQAAVERWLMLKTILYHAYLLVGRRR
jgi:hypothetical protein